MFYLLTPPASVRWTAEYLPEEVREQISEKPSLDLSVLEWHPIEEPFGEIQMRIALRRGLLNHDGIVVGAEEFSDVRQITALTKTSRDLKDAQQQVRSFDTGVMEQLMPGWAEEGDRLNAEIDESTRRTIEEAEAQIKSVLEELPNSELVNYWSANGGVLPHIL